MNIEDLRESIDNIDSKILALLSERFKLTETVGMYKYRNGMPAQDEDREKSQFKRLEKLSSKCGLNYRYTKAIYRCIIDLVITLHKEIAYYGYKIQSVNSFKV